MKSTHSTSSCFVAAAIIVLSGCGSSHEKAGIAPAAGEASAVPFPAQRVVPAAEVALNEHTRRALVTIQSQGRLSPLELNRLKPIAKTVDHARTLIDRITDPVERKRAMALLQSELDRSAGGALTPEQRGVVRAQLLASDNP